MPNKIIISKNIQILYSKLDNIWKSLFIVWWYTRDNLINSEYSWDIDLATDASPDEVKNELTVIKQVWKKYWTLIVKQGKEIFEITTFRKEIWILDNRKPVKVKFTKSLKEDSMRRDFTFNSIYFDLRNNNYIDPQNWIKDLNDKKIRFIWNIEDRINEDALRILRFIRFKYKYGFNDWWGNYQSTLTTNSHLLKNISIERIKDEFEKILFLNNIYALKELRNIWFFKHIIPELHNLGWDLWSQLLNNIEKLNKLFKSWFKFFNNLWKDELCFFDDKKKKVLYYVILFEFMGKDELYLVLNKLRFSNNQKEQILYITKNYKNVLKIMEMEKLLSRKFMMNKYFKELVIIWNISELWKSNKDKIIISKLYQFYKDFLEILKSKKFFTWKDIIQKYPNLKWIDIKNKLISLNDEILISDNK